jgi:hypothetical protein
VPHQVVELQTNLEELPQATPAQTLPEFPHLYEQLM